MRSRHSVVCIFRLPNKTLQINNVQINNVDWPDSLAARFIGSTAGRRAGRRGPDQEGAARGDDPAEARAGAVRGRLQEQGRAAAARRRDRLPAIAARRPADRGRRPEGQPGRAPPAARRAVRRAGLQDHDRPVRRPARVRARLLGHAQGRPERPQLDPGAARAREPDHADAREPPRGHRVDLGRRHRRAGRPEEDLHGRHALRRARARDPRVSIDFPDPVIEIVIEPKTKADQDKLSEALQKLAVEDPSFRVHTNEETGQTLISGQGELHLEIIVDRLLREFQVQASVGKPQVAYKETITQPAHAVGKFVRQSGGKGQYGHVVLELEPLERGKGIVFETKVVGGRVPREYFKAIEQGAREALQTGVLAGFPVVDVRVRLVDGSYHEVDSSELAFKIAASMGVKDGLDKGKPQLLEPIMFTEVVAPESFMGAVIDDLNSRRGRITGVEARGNTQVIRAEVPLGKMFGYVSALRSTTQGRAIYTMQFHHYAPAPESVVATVVQT